MFVAFVIYPICYGIYLGDQPALYAELFSDPRYLTAVLNTILYVGIGVNVKMFLAFLLSGFFMRKRWWVKALLVVYILPWATPALPAYMSIHWFVNGQWGLLNNALYWLFGIDGPVYLNDHWMGLACNIGAYIWKNMPFWTIILLAGRMAIPQELYEAAAVDGATGLRKFAHVTYPLMANLYLVCILLDTVFALGDFNATYFVSGGGPAMTHRGAGDARHPLRVHRRAAASRRGDGDVGAARADPTRHHPDAQAAPVGGTTMSATTPGPAHRLAAALPFAAVGGRGHMPADRRRTARVDACADLQHVSDRAGQP